MVLGEQCIRKTVGHKTDRKGQGDGCGGTDTQVHGQTDGCMARKVAGAGSADALRMEGEKDGQRQRARCTGTCATSGGESHLMNTNNEL